MKEGTMSHRIMLGGAAVVTLLVAGCGSSSSSSSSSSGGSGAKGSGGPVSARTYSVTLKGASEVPPGAPKARGKAVISIRGTTGQLCWKFSGLTGFGPPMAAHVHGAPAGYAGSIVVPLGGAFTPSGCTQPAKSVLAAIEASLKSHYVNVHSAKFPNGAVRGQL